MATKLIVAPAIEPVTLEEAKVHLRVTHSSEDTLITALITAAREYVENVIGRKMITQTWDLIYDYFPGDAIKLPFPPLVEVVSVNYLDENAEAQVLASTEYVVDDKSEPGWVSPVDAWPATQETINAMSIRFTAGYGVTSDYVPAGLRAAILLVLGDLYENREARSQNGAYAGNDTVNAMIYPYRIFGF